MFSKLIWLDLNDGRLFKKNKKYGAISHRTVLGETYEVYFGCKQSEQHINKIINPTDQSEENTTLEGHNNDTYKTQSVS